MGLWDPVRREHVLAAVQEYDDLGQVRFLGRYGFRPARAYQLVVDGKSYDSKAVLGAAYGHATGTPLSWRQFNGGVSYNGAAWALRRLGFDVMQSADTTVQRVTSRARETASRARPAGDISVEATGALADVVLVGCVKTKRDEPAPACDLYTSPLFLKRRAYAEAAGRPWYILSALHGLVPPGQVLEPYDMYLAGQPSTYRREWAQRVLRALIDDVGSLGGRTVEIHAGSSYVDPLEPLLRAARATVATPLRGLTQGEHLAWYRDHPAPRATSRVRVQSAVDEAVQVLTTSRPALASAFPWGRSDLRSAGIYAWWADERGAEELGLPSEEALTLIYAGQAGATRWPSGTRSNATLFSRISGQHLGGRISSSTLRRTLAALLREHLALRVTAREELDPESEERLSGWMRNRLAATVWPTSLRDELGNIEAQVIARLDAPLNLAGAVPTELRQRLSAGRQALRL